MKITITHNFFSTNVNIPANDKDTLLAVSRLFGKTGEALARNYPGDTTIHQTTYPVEYGEVIEKTVRAVAADRGWEVELGNDKRYVNLSLDKDGI
jgi:hypothetical protein